MRIGILGPASLAVAFALALSLFGPGRYSVHADGGWLDAPPVGWNTPSMAVPAAPGWDLPVDPRAAVRERTPETEADEALAAAGWRLFRSYEAGWGIIIVQGAGGYDGMGRPMQYQAFVFVDGLLAGTLSPALMDARTDGALVLVSLSGRDSIIAEFRRYAAADPLCCPSGGATVEYAVHRQPGGPVVVPSSISRQLVGSA